jgi:cobalamin biosynthesis Co2+ chelatase CbiK
MVYEKNNITAMKEKVVEEYVKYDVVKVKTKTQMIKDFQKEKKQNIQPAKPPKDYEKEKALKGKVNRKNEPVSIFKQIELK